MNPCKGVLKPVGIESFAIHTKLSIAARNVMNFTKNIMASDDNMDLIIELSTHPIPLMNSNKKVAFLWQLFNLLP